MADPPVVGLPPVDGAPLSRRAGAKEGRPASVPGMRILIDPERCTGHGRCYSLAPALVEADDQGHGSVIGSVVPDDQLAAARTAASNCPEQAISLVED